MNRNIVWIAGGALFFLGAPLRAETCPAADTAGQCLRRVVQDGMQPEAVAGLREEVQKLDGYNNHSILAGNPTEVLIQQIKHFSKRFEELKARGAVSKKDIKEARKALENILEKLDLDDAALKAAYLTQLAPAPVAQKLARRGLRELRKRAKSGASWGLESNFETIQDFIKAGDWQSASAQFSRLFDSIPLEQAVAPNQEPGKQKIDFGNERIKFQGQLNFVGRILQTHRPENAKEFAEYKNNLGNGLKMIEVPIPYQRSEYDAFAAAADPAFGGIAHSTLGSALLFASVDPFFIWLGAISLLCGLILIGDSAPRFRPILEGPGPKATRKPKDTAPTDTSSAAPKRNRFLTE